jgi:hypothetical protein
MSCEPLLLELRDKPVGQTIHECEVSRHLGGAQHGLVGVARHAQCSHVGSGDGSRCACELAGIRQQSPQPWRRQFMVSTDHRVDKYIILFDQTERRPVMFDSVVALVRA